jgi:hypothetical protein
MLPDKNNAAGLNKKSGAPAAFQIEPALFFHCRYPIAQGLCAKKQA